MLGHFDDVSFVLFADAPPGTSMFKAIQQKNVGGVIDFNKNAEHRETEVRQGE